MRRSAESLLEELRRLREHERIEAKRGMGKEVLRTLVAFSNEPGMRGGWLLLGIESPTYAVVGVADPERVTEQIASQCSNETLSRPIRPEVSTEEVEGKRIVVVYAPEAPLGDKPIFLRSLGLPRGAFRRVGTSDVEGVDTDLDRYREAASGPYGETVLDDADESHLDSRAVAEYLAELRTASPGSELLGYPIMEVVEALGGLRRAADGALRPTVVGLLLFGTRLALRRFLPMASRVDYLRIDGTDWVPDPEHPFSAVLESREPLLTTFKRTYRTIVDDLTTAFSFGRERPQREEESTIPRRVIREALVNALTHRNYRLQSPTQILRFNDRLELRNPGHSLVEEDAFGTPGSQTRNPHLVQFFHDLRLAESKGTGVRVMRRQMKDANLSPPVFDSDRRRDTFSATFLLHHLLGDRDRTWLESFASYGLTDEQAHALAYARHRGSVRNSVLRDLTGLDVLAASAQLRKLRDLGLLEAQGSGAATYYKLAAPVMPVPAASEGGEEGTPQLALPHVANRGRLPVGPETQDLGSETQDLGSETQDLGSETQDLGSETQDLPSHLAREVFALGKRPSAERLRAMVKRLCERHAYTAAELATILGRKDVTHLVSTHLAPMVEEGILERVHATPNHPSQAYRARQGALFGAAKDPNDAR